MPLSLPVPAGVEAFNAIVSTRHNRHNNHGGTVKGKDGERRKLDKFEVMGRWMGRYTAWQSGLADQLFMGDHAVMDCASIVWDEGKGACVPTDEAANDEDGDDGEWFEMEEGLDETTKTRKVEEVVMKMEDDDEGWNSEDEIQECAEGDEDTLQQGRELFPLNPDGDIPRAPRARTQNPNHSHTI